MTHLLREFLGRGADLRFPALALVVFFFAFTLVLGKLFRGWVRRESYDRVASLPLEDNRERRGSA